MESVREAINNKTTVTFENQYVTNDFDKTFTVEITSIFSRDIHKGTVILLKDITEQRKSFEMIRQTQIMLIESEHLASLGQLVGGIAHNLKTPIMSISGGLVGLSDLVDEYEESVSDDTVTVEDHREIANEMRTWIGKIKEYTTYMSDVISTVKGQAVQLTASTTDSFMLKELIKRVDILMNHELKKYGCRLNVRCMIDQSTEVKGEINSFVQVINNLILNSIEAYEGKEGDIDLTISKNDSEQMICFEVRDSGCGMTDEVKKKLFKEMITTKAKNGTGLGLYMSYSTITGRFGGKMWFESVYGMGTTFYIMVPAV
jgi:signal transduction histidine kinase